MKRVNFWIIMLFLLLLFLGRLDRAAGDCPTDDEKKDRPNDRVALQGVKVGRIFWDITIADPKVLAGRIGVIDETYRDMVRQGVTPEMVLAFRGGAVRLLNADLGRIPEDQRDGTADSQRRLKQLMQQPGIRVEACYIAMRRIPLEPENMMRGVHTVGNTFLSAVGFGQKGYISIPVY